MSKKQKTNENAGKTSERKPRIFGRIDESTWTKWKKAASDRGLTFTEWASQSLNLTVLKENRRG